MPYDTKPNEEAVMPDISDYMTTEEAAKELGFKTAKSVRNMIYNGTLEFTYFGRTIMVKRKSVEEYRRSRSHIGRSDNSNT